MRLSVLVAFSLLLSANLFAQKEELRAEVKQGISESFNNYKTSFENANNCMKVVYECFQSAMSVENARMFASEAENYAGLATKFAGAAAEDAAEAEQMATNGDCPNSGNTISMAQALFYDAKSDFFSVSENLTKASKEEDLDKISDLLVEVMEIVQVGIKKLNEGAGRINEGIKSMADCD